MNATVNKATETMRKIDSLLLILQESAETGDMDSKIYVDVLEVIRDMTNQLATLLSTEGRAIA